MLIVVSDVRVILRLKKHFRCSIRRLKLGQLSVVLLGQQSGRETVSGVSRGMSSSGSAPAEHAGGTRIDNRIYPHGVFLFFSTPISSFKL